MKKPKSFTKFSRVCPHHLMRETTHECYCELIDSICNLTDCPRFNKEAEIRKEVNEQK